MDAKLVGFLVLWLTLAMGVAARAQSEVPASYYDLHIIAVDSDGSAMWPGVIHGKDGFKARPRPMEGERLEGPINIDANGQPQFRVAYYSYISRILQEIRRTKPKRVVFYIHGGMNFITGAIAKGAQLAEDVRGKESEEYRISICWSSNLFSTYAEHLTRNFEGLNRPILGGLTSPLTLLSDVGGAICSAPRTCVRLLSNDVHAMDPMLFQRDLRAYTRQTELDAKPRLGITNSMNTSLSQDERAARLSAGAMDLAAWGGTIPAKIATAPFIDQLGSGAWQMMNRRTRTMFERESSLISDFFRRDPNLRELNKVVLVNGMPRRAHELTREQLEFNEKAIYAGRLGAVRLFFEQAEKFITSLPEGARQRTDVVLIGHSMGAIVSNEILARFIHIDFDHIVFLAAACKVNDFARVGVPYLRNHPHAHFYNLCLNPAAERAEAEPGKLMLADPVYLPLEIAPRGSLPVWIDSFLDHPESEGDRTLGRWENAVLVADSVPQDILSRMTLKGFGRDRSPGNVPPQIWYTKNINYRDVRSGGLIARKYFAEPREHGQFTRSNQPDKASSPNFDFTAERYWNPEKPQNTTSR